jgi:serine/threonine protein kinase/WD40 repeat protein
MASIEHQARLNFLVALDRAPDQWPAFLDEACGDNADLRARVVQLLQAHQGMGSINGGGGDSRLVTMDEPGREKPGAIIGPYKLLQEIGEGGMGTVFMAEQSQPVQRKVALKIIKPGMDTRQVVARFEAERQALALMDHPNIARVLDAGTTESGRPYFVMELVKGIPITRYCDEHRLTPKQRLELFVPVCQAVQHAHQKGIIHRDLKPSNVLVAEYDDTPVAKVIDFGVAKATGSKLTERTMFTQLGQIVGTLEYMSPEQAKLNALDIDTRSDIYALGVLLYELLTGTTPLQKKNFEQAAFDEMLRIIREEEPPRPSTRLSTTKELPTIAANRGLEAKKLSGLVRGELDWIVMKALEKDRNRRYETANGFARDIQRYLADEPVWACPPSVSYRFRKFVRRNTVLFTTALVVAATLLVAVVGVTWKWFDAEQARQQEELAKERAEGARTRAEGAEQEAFQAERKARLREAEALLGQARGTRLSRRPGQRFEALAALKKAAAIGRELKQPPAFFDRLRNEAIAALALPDVYLAREFGHVPPGKAAVALSDDFELYVQTTEKGDCTVHRVADGSEVARLPKLGEFAHADFGPGRTLAVHVPSTHHFQLWDVSSGVPARRWEANSVHSWTFHRDGHSLALAHLDDGISVHAVATGKLLHRLPALEAAYVHLLHLRFHPTEPLIAAFSYTRRTFVVRDLQTGAVVASDDSDWPVGNGRGDWSPDGRTLLVPEAEGTKIQEYAFDLEPPKLRKLRTHHSPYQGNPSLTFDPTGERFVTRGWSGTVHLFDAGSGYFLLKTPGLPRWTDEEELHFDQTGHWLASARVGNANDRIGVWSFAAGLEYRYLQASGWAEHPFGPAVHRGGRLAAIGRANGFDLFDLETGRKLQFVSLPGNHTVARFDGAGNLLTNGFNGFFRWPVHADPANPARLIVGPPKCLPFNKGRYPVAASRDGRVIAQSMFGAYGMKPYAGGWILHPNSPKPRQVDAGQSMGWTSVSPNGRWVAFGWDYEGKVNVYNAATGARVWQSPAGLSPYPCFSPDGHWLLTNVDGGRIYAVGTWKRGLQLGPGTPWDATSELAILGLPNGTYRLVELATGRELARLEDQEQNTGEAAFSPDGSKLVIEAEGGLRVWDLRRIRAGLVKLGLDWHARPYPKAEGAGNMPPLEVTIDRGDVEVRLLTEGYLRVCHELRTKGDLAGALAAIQKVQARTPDDPRVNSYLAWMLVVCPDPQLRDAQRAVQLAKKAVAAEPNRWESMRALGVAHHFAGDDEAAVKALTRTIALRTSGNAFDFFPLAAAHQKLGHKQVARQWYDLGVAWAAANEDEYPIELAILRADAEAVLGINAQAEPPADKARTVRKK